jgi:branched-chain amino acid aminotransferase
MAYVFHNGILMPREQVRLDVQNRAFRYGDGVFESIRVMYGQLLFMRRHLDRLSYSLRRLGISFLVEEQQLVQMAQQLLEVQDITGGARLRLTVWRDAPGRFTPDEDRSSFLLEVEKLATNEFFINSNGLRIGEASMKKSPLFLPDIKSTNSLFYVLCGREARVKQLDDVLILNAAGLPIETTNSNIFILKSDRILTPALSTGCLPGIMRQVMMDVLQLNDHLVEEVDLQLEDVLQADEFFLTNSILGIRWISSFNKKRYFRRRSPVWTELLNQFCLDSLTNTSGDSIKR